MTAGRGIAHSERFDDPAALAGGAFEMIQSWVALPEADEECDPSFEHYEVAQLPVGDDGRVWIRLLARAAFRLTWSSMTHPPLFYPHVVLPPGARHSLPH